MNKDDLRFFRKNKRLQAPKILNLEITNRCPLKCPQCYKDPLREMDMDFNFFTDIVKQAAGLGVKRAMLNGGEPVLHPQFFPMVARLNEEGILPTCFTSGAGIDRAFIEKLKKYSIEMLLSFNGSSAEIHNLSRDAFDLAYRTAELFKESGYAYAVNWVARNDNVRDFPNLIKMLKALGCAGITVVCGKVNGAYRAESAMTKDDYRFLKEQLLSIGDYASIQNCNNITAQFTYDMPASRLYGCPAGVSSMCVTVDGSFAPCPHLYYKEKAADGSIMDYWENSVRLNQLRANPTPRIAHCESCRRNKKCNFCRAICPESHGDFTVGYADCPLYEEGEEN